MIKNQDLQLMLARKLPDKITYDEQFKRFHWLLQGNVVWPEIVPTEWLEIVRMVEETLTPKQEELYVEALSGLLMDDAYENCPRYHKSNLCARDQNYRASYQQRTTALHEIGVI